MPVKKTQLFQIKITLTDSHPLVWRRLHLSSNTTLKQLHIIIQISMGWKNSHLHLFKTDKGTLYGPPEEDDGSLPMKDESSTTLAKVLRKTEKKLHYEYDFGDGWMHEILLEKQLPLIGEAPAPRCIQAKGACPPEDVGGIGGYAHFLDAINDPQHPDHGEMAYWLGDNSFDPNYDDIGDINESLQILWRNPNQFDTAGSGNPAESFMQTVNRGIAEEGIETEEELQNLVQSLTAQQNQQPRQSFCGLNPEQMHILLNAPFDSPSLLKWSEKADGVEQTPIMRMLDALFEQLETRDIKLTPKGNLPLATVRAMGRMLNADELDMEWMNESAIDRLRSEDDFMAVKVSRLLAQLSGLVNIHNNRLKLTATAQQKIRQHPGNAYLSLLRAMLQELNWPYVGGFDEIPGIQSLAPFNFWLLHRHSGQWHTVDYYADAFIEAFPMITDEVTARTMLSPAHTVAICYRARVIPLFHWFGLIDQRSERMTDEADFRLIEIKASTLFTRLIEWR